MRRIAVLIMGITVVSKILGLVREMVLAYFYGASAISDAYILSITISTIIFILVVNAISIGYIPLYRKIENEISIEEGNRFTNNLINIILILSTLFIILGLTFTEEIVKIFASGFDKDTMMLSIEFTKISLLGIYFTGIITLLVSFLQLKGNYVIPALISLPMNFLIIISIILSSFTNIYVLAIGSLIGIGSQLFFLIPFVRKKGFKYQLLLDFKNKYLRELIIITLPIMLGVSVDQINLIVDRTIASQVTVGGISALSYTERINGFIFGIFVLSITGTVFPLFSKLAIEGNVDAFKRTLLDAIKLIILILIPITVCALFFAEPIVALLFGRGAFDSTAISLTANTFFFYSLGIVGYGLREILSRAFFSLGDSKTPMLNGIIAVILNIVLSICLSQFLGMRGIALASSISVVFSSILLWIKLERKIGSFRSKSIITMSIKMSIVALFIGYFSKNMSYKFSDYTNANISLLLILIVYTVFYFVFLYFMKIEEVRLLVNLIKEKINRKV